MKQCHITQGLIQELQTCTFASFSPLTTKHCDRHFVRVEPIIDYFMFGSLLPRNFNEWKFNFPIVVTCTFFYYVLPVVKHTPRRKVFFNVKFQIISQEYVLKRYKRRFRTVSGAKFVLYFEASLVDNSLCFLHENKYFLERYPLELTRKYIKQIHASTVWVKWMCAVFLHNLWTFMFMYITHHPCIFSTVFLLQQILVNYKNSL